MIAHSTERSRYQNERRKQTHSSGDWESHWGEPRKEKWWYVYSDELRIDNTSQTSINENKYLSAQGHEASVERRTDSTRDLVLDHPHKPQHTQRDIPLIQRPSLCIFNDLALQCSESEHFIASGGFDDLRLEIKIRGWLGVWGRGDSGHCGGVVADVRLAVVVGDMSSKKGDHSCMIGVESRLKSKVSPLAMGSGCSQNLYGILHPQPAGSCPRVQRRAQSYKIAPFHYTLGTFDSFLVRLTWLIHWDWDRRQGISVFRFAFRVRWRTCSTGSLWIYDASPVVLINRKEKSD